MPIDVLYQKKEELASIYLEDLKKELGLLQSGVVDLLSKRLKKRMISGKTLNSLDDLKMTPQEKKLSELSPATADKIFTFIKEKQEKIASATTVEELENLKNDMREGNSNIANTVEGTAIGTAGAGITFGSIKKIDQLKDAKKIKNIEMKNGKEFAEKMEKQFTAVADDLEKQAKINPKLVEFQRKNILQSAEEFRNAAKGMDEGTMNSVEMLGTLKNKLPTSILKSITPENAKKLGKLGADFREKSIANKTESEIFEALEKKGITGLDKQVVKVLTSAENVTEFKAMVGVMERSKGVLGFLRGMKGILVIDIIVTGINVFMLTSELDEAEAYKKINKLRGEIKSERARVQFGTTTALIALETIGMFAAFGTSFGPLGTVVGLAAGAVTVAITQAIDIYYDKVEFYSQNQDEFKKQYRTEIKESIIQSAASEERNLNMQARLDVSAKKAGASRAERYLKPCGLISAKKEKLTTTEDARRALIWQEEYTKSEYPLIQQGNSSDQTEDEFKKTLSASDLAAFEKEKKQINNVIDIRMAYIKKFMYENKNNKEYKTFVAAMKDNMGIKMIEKILADSKTQYEMQQTGPDQYITGSTTIDAYTKNYQEKLQKDNAAWFTECEAMRKTDQYKFLEVYYGVKNYDTYVFESGKSSAEFPYKDKVSDMQARIDFIKHYYAYKTIGVPVEDQKKMMIYSPTIDNNQIQEILISGNLTAGVLNLNGTNAKDYFMSREYLDRMESNIEVSDSVGQNIIYRIASEFHGYTGDNDMKQLIEFFRKDKGEALGLYYDNKRIVNNDRAIDKGIDINAFETMTTEEILKTWVSPNNRNYVLSLLDPVTASAPGLTYVSGVSAFGFTDNASMIDTKADAGDMDKKINTEYWKKLSAIIAQEKGFKLPNTKKTIETSIVEYIKKNSQRVGKTISYDPVTQKAIHSDDKEQGYIELPYNLIIQAKKAGIGDLRKYIFKYENNQIVACTSKLYITEKLDFSQTKTPIAKEYVSGPIENGAENIQQYVDYVDTAKNTFERFLTFDDNELDIPKEYLAIYQKKITERETLKKSLSTLDSATAKAELTAKYKEYHDYFENTYMAMMLVISKFGVSAFSSNDLDSAEYHQQIESIAIQISTISINDKGMITGPVDQLTVVQKSLFYSLLKTQKIDGKSILELAKSPVESDKTKAIRGVKQMIKSILETEILKTDDKGNIQTIRHGEQLQDIANNSFFNMIPNKKDLEAAVQKNISKNIDKNPYRDFSLLAIGAKETDISKVEIKTLTEEQEATTTQTNEVQKIIESTEPDSVYPGRGLVMFDPDTNVLTSRGKAITIDSKTLTIHGLNIKFTTLKELIMTANLMNRFKAKYPGTKDFYFGSRLGLGIDYGIFKPASGIDVQILDSDVIKEKFPSLLTTDNDVKKEIIDYINSIT